MKKESPSRFAKAENQQRYLVTVFIDAVEYECSGSWSWELHSEAVFCTDVFAAFPRDFEGTKGLIHPSDKAMVLEHVAGDEAETIPYLQFRMITTWGEIKTLTGKNLRVVKVGPFFEPAYTAVSEVLPASASTSRFKSEVCTRAFHISERMHKTGTWWLHLESSEVHYSDGVFAIYDLPAQSLNPHLNTFTAFIHEDDREVVLQAFAAAFRLMAPLHLDFRIITAKGDTKTIRQVTQWEYSGEGRYILYGLLQDISEGQALENSEKITQDDLKFAQRLLQLNEQSYLMGYWYVNLATRKVVYSDAVYRLYGLKPQSIPGGISIFLSFVHLDDRDIVKEVARKIMTEHVPPDIEFRIVRSDGKVRYVRQKGKMGVYGEGEMVMMVTMQDITSKKTGEKKLDELQQLVSTAEFALKSAEEMSAMGSWFMDIETETLVLSEGLYALLGMKTKAVPLTQKSFLHFVYPEDQKRFIDEWMLVLHEGQERAFEFRLVRNGQILHIAASFKIFGYAGRQLFIGTLQDLTVHQELKLELAQHLGISEAITENMPETALLTDEENTIIFWNRQAEVAYGIKKEVALNQNFFDVFPGLKTEEVLQLFQKTWDGETVWMPHLKPPGMTAYHNLLMIPVRSEAGSIIGILHLANDVSKEHEMERVLNERAHFIESLIEASVNRLIVIDRHMNYLYCNEQAASFYGLNKDEIIGKNVLEVFPGSINDPSFDHFKRALKGETVKIPAMEGFRDEHNYEVHLLPIKDDSNVVTAVIWTHYKGSEPMLSAYDD